MVFEKTYSCESINILRHILYFSKTTLSKTQMKGNITFTKPFDNGFIVGIFLIK